MSAPTDLDALFTFDLPADHSQCETCWYCGRFLSRHEHDHLLPRRHGGWVVVPACLTCHELKDRTPLHAWSPTEVVRMVQTVPAGDQRVLWAKFVGLLMDAEGAA